jgi:hypothetical protein
MHVSLLLFYSVLTYTHRLHSDVETTRAHQLETTKAEIILATELKLKLEAEYEKSLSLNNSVIELKASLEERCQALQQLEKEKDKLEYALDSERAQAAEHARREGEVEKQLAALTIELESEQGRNRELAAGFGQQSTE